MEKRKVLLSHRRALGDELMFTSGVRDFTALFPHVSINIETGFPDLWLNNPHLDKSVTRGTPGVEIYRVGYPIIQNCNGTFNHFTFAFLLDIITILDGYRSLGMSLSEFTSSFSGGRCGDGDPKLHETQDPFKSYREKWKELPKDTFKQRGDIHLTEDEKNDDFIQRTYGIDDYWVVAPGGKRDCTTKIWDWRRFQKVIDHFSGFIKFVSIGRSDHLIERLRGIIDLTDRLTVRDIVKLAYHSKGCVSGVSFLMHLAAAVPHDVLGSNGKIVKQQKPCVSIYGGREPPSFTGYSAHQILHTEGAINCCDFGGCWQSRVVPINKNDSSDTDKNKRLCHHTVEEKGRTIPKCMDIIEPDDVIRAIEIYYSGNVNQFKQPGYERIHRKRIFLNGTEKVKEMNFVASLQSKGGGEQSACKIVELLRDSGWKVNFYAWEKVHPNYKDVELESVSFLTDRGESMKAGLPLFFYANDQINAFCDEELSGKAVEKSSMVVIGVNYVNGKLVRAQWLSKKLKAVIFQNQEKRDDFINNTLYPLPEMKVLYGAISLDNFLEVTQKKRAEGEPLVILKHCCPDYRKYVTRESKDAGEKVHLWQKNFKKDLDTQFYQRLLSHFGDNIRFEFMEAHSELVNHFKDEQRMVFHKWDSIPVTEFLSRGHVFLYRTSNAWRDQYPRVVAEALAAGLPVLTEPRDGTLDRVKYGDTGFYCVDYDAYVYCIKAFLRKEGYRFQMGMRAKEWARDNLNPLKWVDVLEELCFS